ncbi:MAG: carbohydrate ABC transporter permease [Eubacteriales bacterium]|nr:carbohydrate ABC transporter permease [Eubacteriales bacterium]
MKIKPSQGRRTLMSFSYAFTGIFAVLCLIPFLLVISASFTEEHSIYVDGYHLIPKVFSLDAYRYLLNKPDQIVNAYGVTLLVTAVGSAAGLFLIAMGGYVLQRPEFRYRNFFSFFVYFTMLFNGGLVPTYMWYVKLGLKDSLLVLILPLLMSAWNVILMKNFMRSIPHEITEAAKIDGAGDFRIFYKLILPMAVPALATVGLFLGLAYWNDWFNAYLYIDDSAKHPLQMVLYRCLATAEFYKNSTAVNIGGGTMIKLPTESVKMATAVIATGPIIFLYPFVQKYFIKGLTVGAVKG